MNSLPILESHIVTRGPFVGRGLVLPLIQMLLYPLHAERARSVSRGCHVLHPLSLIVAAYGLSDEVISSKCDVARGSSWCAAPVFLIHLSLSAKVQGINLRWLYADF